MLVATSGAFALELGAQVLGNADTPYGRADVFGRCLTLLSRTTPATPGLQSLTVFPMISSRLTAALLSNALLHHTTLTTLTVALSLKQASDSCTAPCVATAVLPTLSHLTHLTSLTLSFVPKAHPRYPEDGFVPYAASPAVADALGSLAEAVSTLPHLARVHLDLCPLGCHPETRAHAAKWATAHTCVAHKRRRLADAACDIAAVSLDSVVAALAAAPCLSRLELSSAEIGQGWSRCAGLRGDFPSLRHFDLTVAHESAAHTPASVQPKEASAWPRPTAPIPAIRSMSLTLRDDRVHSNPEAVALALSSCSYLPNLSTLTVTLPQQTYEGLRQFVVGLRHARQVATLCVDLTPTSHNLVNDCIVRSMPGSLACMTRLTALQLSLPQDTSFLPQLPPEEVLEADGSAGHADTAVAAASAKPFERLREIKLTYSNGRTLSSVNRTMTFFPLAPFSGLTSLTLLFCFPRSCNEERLTRHQLPQLTGLNRLILGPLQLEGVAALEKCLLPLTRLTHLELEARPVGAALVRCVACCAARTPRLAMLELRCAEHLSSGKEAAPVAQADWVEGLRALPCWGSYSMRCHNPHTSPAALSAVRQELADRGAQVSEDCCSIKF